MVTKREVLEGMGAGLIVAAPAGVLVIAAPRDDARPPCAPRPVPLPADPIKECERLAAELARAMSAVRRGNYRVSIRHDLGLVQIVDHAFKAEEEGPLVGAEAYEKWQQKRRAKRLLARA